MKINKLMPLTVLLCCVTVMWLFNIPTLAAVSFDKEKECSLELSFTPEGIKASGVEFKAYKVANVTASYEFEVEPQFKNGETEKLLNNPDAEKYSILASTLPGTVVADKKIEPIATAVTDKSGITEFKGLKMGLYLVVGKVYKSDTAYYTPQSFLVSFPELLENGLWNYDIISEVKWEKRLRDDTVNLEVLKVWSDSATNLHANDSVTVLLYKDDTLYDTIVLSKENNWSHRWNNLYGGAVWSVKEKEYDGYTGIVEHKDERFVITNTPKNPVSPPAVIPQTGLLRWPVPILAICGILLVAVGVFLRRKGEK